MLGFFFFFNLCFGVSVWVVWIFELVWDYLDVCGD